MAAAAVLVMTTGCGAPKGPQLPATALPQPAAPLPADLLPKERVISVIQGLIDADTDKEGLAAYLYPEVLRPGDEVSSWGDDPEEGIAPVTIDKFSHLAWIDREPGNIFYSHDTEFVIIDARTGEFTRRADGFWPVVNGVPFEGSASTLVAGDLASSGGSDGLRARVHSYVKGLSIPAASAAADKRLRIAADAKNAPPGEYYALVVAGFGRNAYVFLEGAQAMYDALKAAGYDDGHITYLAPGYVKVDPAWNHKGVPQLVDQAGVVDGITGPANLQAALKAINEKMTEKDSLFVFVLAHGKKGSLKIGKRLSDEAKEAMEVVTNETLLRGGEGTVTSGAFSAALLGGRNKACEVMVIFDSCYSGSQRAELEKKYDSKRIKRLAAAFSTDADHKSYGADLRDPVNTKKKAVADLDAGAKPKTPTPDPNPADFGGEFSSGFISSLGQQVFAAIYSDGVAMDAAKLNGLTKPDMFIQGDENAACVTPLAPALQPPTPPVTPPAPPPAEPAPPTQPMKKISVIPYGGSYITVDQVTQYSAAQCKCCDAAHWHAKSGTVTLLDGRKITDPYAKCGLGKVSEHPVTTIEVAQ